MFDIMHDIVRAVQSSGPSNFSVKLQTHAQATEERFENLVMAEMKAEEQYEAETDPVLKKRMRFLIDHGIYNFDKIIRN